MASIKQIMEFFNFTSVTAFMRDWKKLDERDQKDLLEGLESLSYDRE